MYEDLELKDGDEMVEVPCTQCGTPVTNVPKRLSTRGEWSHNAGECPADAPPIERFTYRITVDVVREGGGEHWETLGGFSTRAEGLRLTNDVLKSLTDGMNTKWQKFCEMASFAEEGLDEMDHEESVALKMTREELRAKRDSATEVEVATERPAFLADVKSKEDAVVPESSSGDAVEAGGNWPETETKDLTS